MRDRPYLWFVLGGVGLALSGGLGLAIALPIDAAQGYGLGARWPALAQAHGHLQSMGLVGLIVAGMALRLAPRFFHAPEVPARVQAGIFAALLGGVVLRAAGQSAAVDGAVFRALMAAGAWLAAAGALAFAGAIMRRAGPAARRGVPPALFFLAGSGWFALQAVLGAAWTTDAAIDGGSVLPVPRDQALLFLQFFGVHLTFLLGVASRAFPSFFRRPAAGTREAVRAFALLQAGVGVVAGAWLSWVATGERAATAENAGWLVLAIGVAAGVGVSRAWGRPQGLRAAAQPLGRLLQVALGWLLVSMGLTVFFAGRALARERGLLLPELDAARHLVALGVLMLTIMAMAHMVLPEFAMERLQARSGRWRAWGLGLALSVAAATRAAPGIADQGVPSDTDSWHMAVAGMITLAALAWFGVLLLRALRRQPQLLAEVRVRIQEIRLR